MIQNKAPIRQTYLRMSASQFFISPWVFFPFGLLIGSFLNVVIYRLPMMIHRQAVAESGAVLGIGVDLPPGISLAWPGSACPGCGTPIPWYRNVPVLSYLHLRGKCQVCRWPIPVRYAVVEGVTGLLYAASAWRFGPSPAAFAWAGFAAVLVVLACLDWEKGMAPARISVPALWGGLLASVLGWTVALPDAVLGAAAGYAVAWMAGWAFALRSPTSVPPRLHGSPVAQIAVLAVVGAWLGWQALPRVLLMAALVTMLCWLAIRSVVATTEPDQCDRDRLPLGAFLAASGILATFT